MTALPPNNPLLAALARMSDNPLLQGLPPPMDPRQMALAARYRPIMPEFVAQVPLHQRDLLLGEFRKIFVPTPENLAILLALQHMLRQGLHLRDPRLQANKRFVYETGALIGRSLQHLDWHPAFAAGCAIEGLTGVGKSQVVARYLDLLPQVISHGERKDCGWKQFKQLVWMRIHMPADGSLGGLILNGFLELDRALGTDYEHEYCKATWSLQKQAIVFLNLLARHRCGLLVVEEAQMENIGLSILGRNLIVYLLRVMNWGVPTVLIGNPMAFDNLRQNTQTVDRFSEGGWFRLEPVMDSASKVWCAHWMKGLWSPTLLDQPDPPFAPTDGCSARDMAEFVWRRTAGFPRLLGRLRAKAQEEALRTTSPITSHMVERIFRSDATFVEAHKRIEAFEKRDWQALKQYADIPYLRYRALWDNVAATDATESVEGAKTSKARVRKEPLKDEVATGKDQVAQDNLIAAIKQVTAEAAAKGAERGR